jgi:hypothetical protein
MAIYLVPLFARIRLEEHVMRERFTKYRQFKLMGWTPPDGIDVPKWRC